MPCLWNLVSVPSLSSFPLTSRAPWVEAMDVRLLTNRTAASKGEGEAPRQGPWWAAMVGWHEGGSPAWERRKELAVEAGQEGEGGVVEPLNERSIPDGG